MDIHVRRLAMQRCRSDGSCAAKSCISGTCSGNVSDMNVQATGIAGFLLITSAAESSEWAA